MATRIVLNSRGVRALLNDPGVAADLSRRAHAVAAAAGLGMEVDTDSGGTRARAAVFTATFQARLAEAKSGALRRAIDAAR